MSRKQSLTRGNMAIKHGMIPAYQRHLASISKGNSEEDFLILAKYPDSTR